MPASPHDMPHALYPISDTLISEPPVYISSHDKTHGDALVEQVWTAAIEKLERGPMAYFEGTGHNYGEGGVATKREKRRSETFCAPPPPRPI